MVADHGSLAKELPVLLTHNKNINAHFGNRCLYMRNIKDERTYDVHAYDRDATRAALGFGPEDRVILFGGMLRKHKGIYELVELMERLNDPRYKLLFVGSRETPDQKKLVERYGDKVRVLPPQDREAMARINHAADMVILWLDPDVPASHYQMPYKATDAFAMGPTIIANDISDLGPLGSRAFCTLFRMVIGMPWFGSFTAFSRTPRRTATMRDACRRLFLRQFSYRGGAQQLRTRRTTSATRGQRPARRRTSYSRRASMSFIDAPPDPTRDFLQTSKSGQPLPGSRLSPHVPPDYGEEDGSITVVDPKRISHLHR